jgi:hypothetical protein
MNLQQMFAQNKEPKEYRFGIMSGIGATGSASINKQKLASYTYNTRVGGGWIFPNLYLMLDTRNVEESRFSAKVGYSVIIASVPVFQSNQNFVVDGNYAAEANARYKFHCIHIPIDYHARVYIGNDSRRKTSLIGGPDLGFALKGSAKIDVKKLGSANFVMYDLPKLEGSSYGQFQFGAHFGWQFEKEMAEHRSLVAGYTIGGFFNDLAKEHVNTQMPILYKDGYNVLFTNLFFIGFMF